MMTIEQAQAKLSILLKRQRRLATEIKETRAMIPKPDLKKRNREIYRKYLQHVPVADLATQYRLSQDRIRIICGTLAAQEKEN